MALKSKRNFKTVLGAEDLTLSARTGESILVTDVKIYEPTAVYTNFLIERASVGYFRVAGALGNHLHFLPGRNEHAHDITSGPTAVAVMANGALRTDAGGEEMANSRLAETPVDTTLVRAMNLSRVPNSAQDTLLSYLRKKGIFKGYPVAEGETFTVELCTGATAVKVVEYEIHEAGDITSDMENGSQSKTFMYINYGDSGGDIQAVANNLIDEANNPAEYPDFPFGANVPSGQKIELIGILASDVSPAANAAGTCTQTDYLRFIQGREVLFDEDHNGLLYYSPFPDALGHMDMIAEGYAVGGNYTQCDVKIPHMFEPPMVFNEGEELTVSWHVIIAGAGAVISQELQEVGLILRISPMS